MPERKGGTLILTMLRRHIARLVRPLRFAWYGSRFCTPGEFVYEGQPYQYLYHHYNHTYTNERAVELPIVMAVLDAHSGMRVLEAGNVLSHYMDVDHEIVDKYEAAEDVINEDIVDFSAVEPYDLIVSISTLEHVGWDEEPRDPGKPFRAVVRLKELLAPRGLLIITVPFGQNPHVDRMMRENEAGFHRIDFMQRDEGRMSWRQLDEDEVRWSSPNIVCIATYQKHTMSDQ